MLLLRRRRRPLLRLLPGRPAGPTYRQAPGYTCCHFVTSRLSATDLVRREAERERDELEIATQVCAACEQA